MTLAYSVLDSPQGPWAGRGSWVAVAGQLCRHVGKRGHRVSKPRR